ncbi:hypothetical protein AUK40_05085 [Candidatus Wirthbacteria bacterium CG2_30_54_11]|uniref:Transglycosylase n=1 Tax=Candidatus Wirthbacteria bacterium CG2_30_54_11 TaxID=1817892 RepID=A0A1J5IVR6_9BACT|nr:MAG: hypothetical protein AUK40_05085 [Candidatus Wirthbacteria bacterium CG2_30_54_11]
MNIFLWMAIGITAGWIAAMDTKRAHRIGVDILLGTIGGLGGGSGMNYFGQNDVTGLNLYSLVAAVAGAVALIYLGRRFHQTFSLTQTNKGDSNV